MKRRGHIEIVSIPFVDLLTICLAGLGVVAAVFGALSLASSIDEPRPLRIVTTSLPPVRLGQPVDYNLAAVGGLQQPGGYTWLEKAGSDCTTLQGDAKGLPPGLALSPGGKLHGMLAPGQLQPNGPLSYCITIDASSAAVNDKLRTKDRELQQRYKGAALQREKALYRRDRKNFIVTLLPPLEDVGSLIELQPATVNEIEQQLTLPFQVRTSYGIPVVSIKSASVDAFGSFSSAAAVVEGELETNRGRIVVRGLPPAALAVVLEVEISTQRAPFPVRVDTQRFEIPIKSSKAIGAALEIKGGPLPAANILERYEHRLIPRGGLPPYKWSVAGLPEGLQGQETAGDLVISGVIASLPGSRTTEAGRKITIALEDSLKASQRQDLELSIRPRRRVADRVRITTDASSLTCFNGRTCRYTFSADGGIPSYVWSVASQTDVVTASFNASTLVVRPNDRGNTRLSVAVTDCSPSCEVGSSPDTATRAIELKIEDQARLQILTSQQSIDAQPCLARQSCTIVFEASGGFPRHRWSSEVISSDGKKVAASWSNEQMTVGALAPIGLKLGVLVRDCASGCDGVEPEMASQDFVYEIKQSPPLVITVANTKCVADRPCTISLGASGGVPSYQWTAELSKVSRGNAQISGSTVTLSGLAPGTHDLKVNVSDCASGCLSGANKLTSSQLVKIRVEPSPALNAPTPENQLTPAPPIADAPSAAPPVSPQPTAPVTVPVTVPVLSVRDNQLRIEDHGRTDIRILSCRLAEDKTCDLPHAYSGFTYFAPLMQLPDGVTMTAQASSKGGLPLPLGIKLQRIRDVWYLASDNVEGCQDKPHRFRLLVENAPLAGRSATPKLREEAIFTLQISVKCRSELVWRILESVVGRENWNNVKITAETIWTRIQEVLNRLKVS